MRVPSSGKVVGREETANMVEAAEDLWLTAGKWNQKFEDKLATYTGAAWASTVNSGSSANLAAISSLDLEEGDEVITVAACFPTTVNPILLAGATPVFVDVDIPTYNVNVDALEAAITPAARAIVLAHTLGNPFDLGAVMAIADAHDLRIVEDCCDSLGSTYRGLHVGTFCDVGTLSFYPAHQITTGEGGAVFSQFPDNRRAVDSIRDWGRDCYCAPAAQNTCACRFGQQHGTLPKGYDHKYTYSRLGFNLKMTDMQAACGVAQLARLDGFVKKRRLNWLYLRTRLESCIQFLILPEPTPNSEPSWFGFCMTMTEACDFDRATLCAYLAQEGVDSRPLFAGNLTRQPYMAGRNWRIAGSLANTDIVASRTFWIGCWPGLTEDDLEYACEKIETFLGGRVKPLPQADIGHVVEFAPLAELKGKRILVNGCGWIGGWVFDCLAACGMKAESRVRGDVWPAKHFDLAIHAASGGLNDFLGYVEDTGVDRSLYISSGAIYARHDIYAGKKRHEEELCANHPTNPVIARGFSFVGPRQKLDAQWAVGNFMADALAGRDIVVKGDGSAVRSYMHMADLVVWLLQLLVHGQKGKPYNVGSEDEVSIADLAEKVGKLSGAKVRVEGKPAATDYYVPSTFCAEKMGLAVRIQLDDALERTWRWLN